MTDKEKQSPVIEAGQLPAAINQPWECPTICVDGLYGMAGSQRQVKLQLVEHFATDQDLKARHIINLVFDLDQFTKFAEAVYHFAEQMKVNTSGEEA